MSIQSVIVSTYPSIALGRNACDADGESAADHRGRIDVVKVREGLPKGPSNKQTIIFHHEEHEEHEMISSCVFAVLRVTSWNRFDQNE